MSTKDILEQLSPAEIVCLLTKRKSPVDADKSYEELSVGDLMVMQHNPDILEQYQKDRINLLLSQYSILSDSNPDEDDDSFDELLEELYGRQS